MTSKHDVDNNTKETIGRIVTFLALTTDPANVLRLTSSLISLVWAGLAKKDITKWDKHMIDARSKWKAALNQYRSSSQGWVDSEDTLSDVQDAIIQIAIEEDLMAMRSEWFNASYGLFNQPTIPGDDGGNKP